MLHSWKRKALLLGIEVAYGVDPVLAAATHGVLAMQMTIVPEADKLEREIDRAYYTNNPFVLVGHRVVVEFDFEPMGANPGGVAAPCGPLLEICAHAETLDAVGPPLAAAYNPVSTNFASAAMYFWMGNQRFVILGARGTVNFETKIKTFNKGHARITGILATPTSVPIVSPDLDIWQDPVAITKESWDVTVDGITVNAESLTLDQGNETPMIEGSNEREVFIPDRKAGGTLRLYDPDISVLNLFTTALAHSKVPIISTVGVGTTGKVCRMTIPLAQFELPRFAEQEKVRMLEIPYAAIASDAGDDEYLIEFE